MDHFYNDHLNPKEISMILHMEKETILDSWKKKICQEIPATKYQTDMQLRDSIPKFLDRLAITLSSSDPRPISFEDVNDISEHHGVQRANLQEYTLHEMLSEYRLLREAIFEVLEKHETVRPEDRDIILASIEQGMAESANKFVNSANKKISFQENEYRNLLNSIKDHAIIKTDIHGLITEWNVGAENIIGHKRDEVMGKSSSIIFTEEDKINNAFMNEIITAEREGRAQDERWHLKKDGSLFYAIGILNPLFDESGNHTGFVKVLRDQTSLKLLESELQKKRSQFEAIFNAIPDSVIVADSDRIIIECNPATVQFFEYKAEEIIGKPTSIFYADDGDYRKEGQARYNILSPYKGTMSYPARYRKKNGEVITSETNAAVLRDSEGNVTGYLAIVRDVTERLKAEETLRQMADAMPQMVWTAAKDGSVDYFNDRFFEYTNHDFDSVKGWGWVKLIHPDDIEKLNNSWMNSLKTGTIFNSECRIKRHDGQFRWHLVRAVPVLNEQQDISKWYGTNTDFHDEKLSMEQLIEERELRERFVSALSHDLRTPLTSAKLSAQLMRRSNPENDKIMKSVERVITGIDRADSMIQDLLDANRINAGEQIPIKPDICEVSFVLDQTLDDLCHIHGNRFQVRHSGKELKGFWDCGGIRRIIENLCNNAIKYGNPDTDVIIDVVQRSGSTLEISVQNYGKVLKPDEIDVLFHPFKRSSSAETSGKKGWGIGLTLVKGLVKAHHGEVSVESSREKGTIFKVFLPMDYRNALHS